jgi:hypothetical protein
VYRQSGSITVFLSLILILILALVGTAVEGARIQGSRALLEEGIYTAMDSLFAGYDDTLWKDYQLFFLDGKEKEETRKQEIEGQLKEVFLDIVKPKERASGAIDLYGFDLEEVKVEDIKTAVWDNGVLMEDEIIQTMKFKTGEEFLKKIFGHSLEIKEAGAVYEIAETVKEMETEAGKQDREMIKLMEIIDGLKHGKKGFEYRKGRLKIRNSFVKKFCGREITMGNVGVNHGLVFESAKEKYISVPEIMDQSLKDYEEIKKKLYEERNGEYVLDSVRRDYGDLKSLLETGRELIAVNKNAEEQIQKIEKDSNNMDFLLSGMRKKVEEKRENMSDNVCSLVDGEINKLSGYGSMAEKLPAMKTAIEHNIVVLEEFNGLQEILRDEITRENVDDVIEGIKKYQQVIKNYETEGLSLDYSNLKVKEDAVNPMEVVEKIMSEGILGFIFENPGVVSRNAIDTQQLPSHTEKSVEEQETEYKPMRNILYGQYLDEYFKALVLNGQKAEKETVLQYELEYILGGEKTDYENLVFAIENILVLREGANFLYLLSDSQKRETARETAAVLVGFTGIYALVLITEVLILLAWAFAESLMDMRLLVEGGKVPVYKSRATWQLEFEQLLSLEEGGKRKEEQKGGREGLNYREYLGLCLLFMDKDDKLLRTMDLVQENIKRRYGKNNFLLKNCIYGIQVQISGKIERRFLSYYLQSFTDPYRFCFTRSYCYS